MTIDTGTPCFRTEDRAAVPVAAFNRPEDVLEAMLQSVQGGEMHVRPLMDLKESGRFARFVEIGLALRRAFRDPARRDYFIARMRPHLRFVIGVLPASIQRHGMLPQETAGPAPDALRLEDVGDAELQQWLVDDGSLIYGEMKRYELENYFDAIAPFVQPGGKMIDLGSGLGKVVMSAALALPFAQCTGVELLGYRHAMAQERLARLLELGQRGMAALAAVQAAPVPLQGMAQGAAQGVAQLAPPAPDAPLALPTGGTATVRHVLELGTRIRFIEQDMFQADVSDASLVFIYSTCFAPLMDALAAKLAREVQQGCLVSCTTFPLSHPAFRLLRHFPAQTIAWTGVFLYERVGAPDGLPLPPPAYLYAPDPDEWEARARAECAAYDIS
ncbi:histone methylation protein DOT1-like protein [Pseudoduganella sp. LjRoot289]|uniref:histone methylation protein DOT1-like protein n=1 Tax=Pseudoduganella sp. LjRoot289 TaxID=3342314 RepID=UPI003ED114D0